MICEKCGKECEAIITCTEIDEHGRKWLSHKSKCCGSYGVSFELNETCDIKPQGKNIEPAARMSLRDYFAAKAMQSLMPILKHDIDELTEGKNGRMVAVCQMAYGYADAMLKAREEK